MRILYLTPYIPTPIRARPYNLLKALAGRGHAITLLSIAQGEGLFAGRPSAAEQSTLEELRAHGIRPTAVVLPRWRSLLNCLLALPTSTPLQAVYCWSPRMARLLRDQVSLPLTPCPLPLDLADHADVPSATAPDPYDILHIEHLRAARYGVFSRLGIGYSNYKRLPLIWDSVDCISHLFAQAARQSRSLFWRLITRVELPRTRCYEAMLLRAFDRTVVTSAVDQAAFATALQESQPADCPPLTVLPNGVDLAYFAPGDTPRRALEIVFSGKMSYHANVTAVLYLAQEIMPLIWEKHPDAHLTIAGSEPPPAVRALSGPHITVTGYVPDLRPYLRQAVVAVAPIVYSAGLQYKVLEAMACATPVVATPQTAAPLAARAGEEILVGGSAAELAAHIARLLDNPEYARQIGQAGRLYVERHHDWETIAGRLEEVYWEEVARRGKPHGDHHPVAHRSRS